MNNRESSAEGLLNSAYARKAIQLLEAGIPPRKVIDKLFQEGMAPEKAHTLINEQTQLPIAYSKKSEK